ncbi:MAG: amidohydrolase family protein [Nanoarchaeota archaeon]|nr:amidohydrolase family protein [Nanoarchaeota archaeon]MBU1269039.1 amidohydrolase family protein [Nanoarchaeota archaeon]MBU1604758.1 amidohydrolase family protein [Nanoarchaeota archaeon]MBU2443372.1 amidohydrolase family protein [Nanoarchaeota archaeon]
MRIDPHVHFRDEEQNYKETIAHGLSVAKEQGVDFVFDMPNTARPVLRESDVIRRLALVPKSEVKRYYLYVGATSNPEQLEEAVSLVKKFKEVIGIKMFAGKSTGDLAIIDEEEQRRVYDVLAKNNYEGVLVVHCEKEAFMTNTFDPKNPYTHALSRPNIAEVESIKDQIKFAKETGFKGTLHICHISCKESLEVVDKARGEIRITCGATPHHLLWNDEMLKETHGLLYKMNPPLRSKEDVEALRVALKSGKIDWVETDHAPHTIGEKLHSGYPSGYPTLYLYKEFVEEFLPSIGLSKKQIEDLTFNNIVKAFGLKI